jgi:hypothetical protein
MTTGVTCTVLVDGVRAADGSPGDDLTRPVVLDDLSVTWGREDTMSQPDVDTCTFQVMDQAGGEDYLNVFRTGARVDVSARGLTYPDPTIETFVNPGFETAAPVTWTANGGTATRTSARARSGAYSLAVLQTVTGEPVTVMLAPGELQPTGTNPGAWDTIPTTSPGQTWTVSATLWAPRGSFVYLRGLLFTGPWASSATPAGPSKPIVGNDAWQTVTIQVPVQAVDAWLGVQVAWSFVGGRWDWSGFEGLTWDTVDPSRTWDDLGTVYVDDVSVKAPATGIGRTVLVFSGRISDLSVSWDTSTGSPVAEVTCVGFSADLDNRVIGADPWPVEDVDLRAHRIVELSGLPIALDIDPTLGSTLLSYRDVDAQGAAGLLAEIAESVDGVLWPAVHQLVGAYLRLEDPAQRASLLKLALVGGVIVVVQGDPDVGFDLSSCVVLRDPVTWVQDVSDIITRVSVEWLVQGVDDDGLPTTEEATELVVDTAREARHGTRGASISTQLQSAVDAQDVAQRVMARSTPTSWRAEGLTIDDDDVDPTLDGIALVLALLDGTRRIGAAIVLGDLPSWTPSGASVGVYLEGGTYTFVDGRWVLELTVSASTGLGQSAAWNELDPAWTWNQWSPGLTWNDLRGVYA